MSATEQRFVIAGPAGQLEIKLLETDAPLRGLAVMCHPHPLHGGTMENKVVYTVQRAMVDLGFHCARFNFRGVGESQGVFDHGNGEADDLNAVTAWLKARFPQQTRLWLAGFSFGSYVAARSANVLQAEQLISIAPPVQRFDFSTMDMPRCPWLVVMGDADEVVAPQAVFDWLDQLSPPPRQIRMAGAGHFFHGRLVELRDQLTQALTP